MEISLFFILMLGIHSAGRTKFSLSTLFYLPLDLVRRMDSWIFPPYCDSCGNKRNRDELICPSCRSELRPLASVPHCLRCGRPFPGALENVEDCEECRDRKLYFDRAFAVFMNKGPAHNLVLKLKYAKGLHLAPLLAHELALFLSSSGIQLTPGTIVSCVPQSLGSRLRRGYNQAEEMARHLSRETGYDFLPLLEKRFRAKSQTRLNRRQRLTVNKGTIFPRQTQCSLLPKHSPSILLVDDVYTTGSTLNECARIIKTIYPKASITVLTFLRS